MFILKSEISGTTLLRNLFILVVLVGISACNAVDSGQSSILTYHYDSGLAVFGHGNEMSAVSGEMTVTFYRDYVKIDVVGKGTYFAPRENLSYVQPY